MASAKRLLNRDGTFNVVRLGGSIRPTDLYHSLLALSWPGFLAFVVSAYLAANFVFAWGYYLCPADSIEGLLPQAGFHRFAQAFFFSVQTLATIGYGKISPVGILPNLLVTGEALVGLLGLALATGLLYARFSRPTARVVFSRVALVTRHDGVPSFLFRIANARSNQIVEANISVNLSMMETTAEGETYRTFYDLELERARTPVFALTWTVVHAITPASPLHGLSREQLVAREAEILCSVTGIDDTFSQTIHARSSYTPEEIFWDRAFEDIISYTPDGMRKLEIHKIHSTREL